MMFGQLIAQPICVRMYINGCHGSCQITGAVSRRLRDFEPVLIRICRFSRSCEIGVIMFVRWFLGAVCVIGESLGSLCSQYRVVFSCSVSR